MLTLPSMSFSSVCSRCESPSLWQWQTARTVSTVGKTLGGRGSSAVREGRCVSAATPSSAPTPAQSAIDPSLWKQRWDVFTGSTGVAPFFLPVPQKKTSLPLYQELSHKGRYWHEECFRCAKCYKPLAKEPFSTKDDRIMCGKCCSREDAPRCHGCYKPILAGKTVNIDLTNNCINNYGIKAFKKKDFCYQLR